MMEPIYSDAIVIHMMKTILTALVNVKELYLIQLSMSNERLSEDTGCLMDKLQSDLGKKYGVTSLTHYTLRLSRAIIHFDLGRSDILTYYLKKTLLKKVDLISLFASGYNQIETYISTKTVKESGQNIVLKMIYTSCCQYTSEFRV